MDNEMIRRIISTEVKEVGDRILEFTGSDETLDRADEIIRANGWDFKNYRKNPVFLWAHEYRQPPIGKAIKTWIDRDEKKLKFNIDFAPKETYEFADTIYKLYRGGYLHATSVGFIPKEWEEPKEDDEENKGVRRIFKKQELLELSAVPVPANPNALGEARAAELITTKEFDEVSEWIKIKDIPPPPDMGVELVDNMTEEKPYPNEHACRLHDPKDFQEGSMRRYERDHEGKKYSVIAGRLKGEDKLTEQAFRYKKNIWSSSQASKHCKDHDGTFEAASESSNELLPLPGTEDLIHGSIEQRATSQEELRDEIDYVRAKIYEVGMNEETRETAWDFIRELLRLSGNDIPVDIAEQIGSANLREEIKSEPLEEWTPEDTEAIALRIARKVQGKID